MKILIAGDSFAADWTVINKQLGWVNFLSQDYSVTNIAQAGCSEYKIYLQLSNNKIDDFDYVIISHTSPNRWYTPNSLIHRDNKLHSNSDYIYTDIVANIGKHHLMPALKIWFENFHDLEYANFVHSLICKEIAELVNSVPTIHLSFFDYTGLYEFNRMINLNQIFLQNRGEINHLNEVGNRLVYERVKEIIESYQLG